MESRSASTHEHSQQPRLQCPKAIYSSLNPDSREIRLARIVSAESTLVEITLETVSLDDNPVYEALSYCWGDPDVTATIKVNGQPREVTISLEGALRRFQELSNGDTVFLWVDAICNNQ